MTHPDDANDHHVGPEAGPDAGPDAAGAKRARRTEVRKRLADMGEAERHVASGAACNRLLNLGAFRHASVVMLYMPLVTEVDTTPLAIRCFQAGKTVCVPKVNWKRQDMTAVEVSSFDDHFMETDEHGLRSPRDGHVLPPSAIDLIVVPALAFDDQCHRLGRGGGYYDRFLPRLRRSATAVGLAFDVQITPEVPHNERDVSVDNVVTDRRVMTRMRAPSR